MEKPNVFNFEAKHDHVNRTMTTEIPPFSVVVYWETGLVKTFKNGKRMEIYDMLDGFSLADYEKLLLTVEQSATELNSISYEVRSK